MASFDAYLKIDSIPGEATAKEHEGWIQVESFSFDMSQGGHNVGGGGARGAFGRAVHKSFLIMKRLDKSSPLLYEAVNVNNNLGKVQFHVCRTGDDKYPYFTITFEDVMISSVSLGGADSNQAEDKERLLEAIAFNYTKIEWTYTETDSKNKKGGAIVGKWNLATNDKS